MAVPLVVAQVARVGVSKAPSKVPADVDRNVDARAPAPATRAIESALLTMFLAIACPLSPVEGDGHRWGGACPLLANALIQPSLARSE